MAAITTALLIGVAPAGAQDLDCGDPGTSPNMSVEPGDPHGLDRDGDGIGCEEEGGGSPSPAPATEPAPAGGGGDGGDGAPVAEGPDASDGSTLPRTGSTTVPLTVVGGVLLLAGVVAFTARRHVYIPRHLRTR